MSAVESGGGKGFAVLMIGLVGVGLWIGTNDGAEARPDQAGASPSATAEADPAPATEVRGDTPVVQPSVAGGIVYLLSIGAGVGAVEARRRTEVGP